jgi:hypothetical protein
MRVTGGQLRGHVSKPERGLFTKVKTPHLLMVTSHQIQPPRHAWLLPATRRAVFAVQD